METRYRTFQEYEAADRRRDRFRAAVPDPDRRRTLLRQFVRACLEPAERELLALTPADDRPDPPSDPAEALGASLDALFAFVSRERGLGVADIGALSARWNGGTAFRQHAAADLLDPVPAPDPATLEGLLANSLDWFGVGSVMMMHPVEKCNLLTIRLADLRPFPAWNFGLVRLVPWYFLVQADFPPPLLTAADAPAWRAALALGRELRTQPLAELHRRAVERAWESFVFFGLEHFPEIQL